MDAVFRESASEVIEEMQRPVGAGGNMPVDTGFLRSSLQVGVNTEPVAAAMPNPGAGAKFTYAASMAIAGAEIGDTIVASYSAKYAPIIEYGGGKRQPRRFVALAAAQWPSIVARVAERLKSSVTGP
ncbi:HK97 gp10 family phage protein [Kaistia soli]|nr:HK97 gp10 family phage protein [Kaistia soli]